MGRYDDEDYGNPNVRQRDLVLSTNEFCFLQSKTNGQIKTYTGPITMTISAQESLVIFNPITKRFEETADFEKARQLFTSAPEGWYVVLKNPSQDASHPEIGKATNSPELKIGRKINIPGPCSFSLFPGQMAKVIRGHRLRSNQYLVARVYDADEAKNGMKDATIIDAEGNVVAAETQQYFAGQLLIIKGTEVSFYMPPTGVEVIPIDGKNEYVRDAVTLERLEYAILKDEDGEKRYVHGPAVVFPKPTETFVTTSKKSSNTIFRALELSPISGIYVKVIAEYDEKDKKSGKNIHHPIGEELFITGNDQMIYYPRPEHAMIQYDGKFMHHAIAIPEGEGRYVLNRLTGEIKTVLGPKMYLPDPRKEVIVKRKLTDKECKLLYPNNNEVLEYNRELSEKAMEKMARKGITNSALDDIAYSTNNAEATLAFFEANANISRGTSYTKPRTVTLDTKFDGVISVDIWTGYAVNIVSKTGKREVVIGPTTRLLNYDETLEAMSLSTGKPKTTDSLLETAFLRIENNKIADIIHLQTKDFVDVDIKVSYCVDFLNEYKDKWFSVENYVKYLCDRQRSLLKREAKLYTIEEFYANATDIVRKVALNLDESKPEVTGRLFEENGMFVHDVEVLSVRVESEIAEILNRHQEEIISKTLELSDATRKMEMAEQLAKYAQREKELQYENEMKEAELHKALRAARLDAEAALAAKERAEKEAKTQAEADIQQLLDAIQTAKLERDKREDAAKIETEKQLAEIEKAKQEAYAETVGKVMASISPDLVAALTTKANEDMLETVTRSMSPYAIAQDKSVAEVTNKLLRGTSLEEVIKNTGSNYTEN